MATLVKERKANEKGNKFHAALQKQIRISNARTTHFIEIQIDFIINIRLKVNEISIFKMICLRFFYCYFIVFLLKEINKISSIELILFEIDKLSIVKCFLSLVNNPS